MIASREALHTGHQGRFSRLTVAEFAGAPEVSLPVVFESFDWLAVSLSILARLRRRTSRKQIEQRNAAAAAAPTSNPPSACNSGSAAKVHPPSANPAVSRNQSLEV